MVHVEVGGGDGVGAHVPGEGAGAGEAAGAELACVLGHGESLGELDERWRELRRELKIRAFGGDGEERERENCPLPPWGS